jgi:hypothetical protein
MNLEDMQLRRDPMLPEDRRHLRFRRAVARAGEDVNLLAVRQTADSGEHGLGGPLVIAPGDRDAAAEIGGAIRRHKQDGPVGGEHGSPQCLPARAIIVRALDHDPIGATTAFLDDQF